MEWHFSHALLSANSSDTTAGGDRRDAADGDARGFNAFRRRAPCVPVCVAIAAGILLDENTAIEFQVWWLQACGTCLLWLAARCLRWRRISAVCLCVVAAGVGGARHHMFCDLRNPDSILRHAGDEPQPVRLTGRIRAVPQLRRRVAPAHWHGPFELRFVLECASLGGGLLEQPVAGRVQVSVSMDASAEDRLERGELTLEPGVDISLYGELHRPRGRSNPGGFDHRAELRSRGLDAILYVSDEAYLSVAPGLPNAEPPAFLAPWRRFSRSVRAATSAALRRHLNEDERAVAGALLLGDRTGMQRELSDVFVASGTMHLLSISGLHVGLFAFVLASVCRLARCSLGTTALLVAAGVLSYAGLADVRPPILRAVTLVLIWCAGVPWFRSPCPLNTLALAAIVILFRNPTDLFDPGAQLSFLALLGIFGRDALFARGSQIGQVRGRELRGQSTIGDWLHGFVVHVRQQLGMMFSIWLWTMPLQAAVFHVISPIGILCNLVLIPLLTPVLACGFLFILSAAGAPPLLGVAGGLFEFGLRGLLLLVRLAAQVPCSHFRLPTPSNWWLAGHYIVLLAMMWAACRCRWRWIGVLAWLIIGLLVGLWPSSEEALQCTTLDVGHGCAVLVEFPNGQTLLYDAGAINGGERAFQTVVDALSEFGHVGLDALVISHADVDHCNAVPGLLRRIPVGMLLVSHQFPGVEEAIVGEVLEAAYRSGTPVRLVERGDRIVADERVSVRVRHPPRAFAGVSDNSDSLVLDIEFAGQHILLTGDLEDDGLASLLAHDAGRVLLLLVPHHGSQNVQHGALAEWCRPDWALVSAGRRVAWAALHKQYGLRTQLLWTRHAGAVTCRLDVHGGVRMTTHRARE